MARLNAALFLLPFCGVAGDATCEASSHGCVSDEITLLQARRMTTKGGDEAEPAHNVPEPSYSVSAAGNICYDSHDLLFRIPPIGVWTSWSDITLEQCYEQCAATEGCNHFSYKSGACMGCTTVVNSQDGPVTYFMNGFVTYDMPFQLETQCLGTYQAEDATLSGASAPRSPYHQGFTGSSYVDYGPPSGAYIEWTLSSCSGGDASVSFRYALKHGNRPLQVLVNDEEMEASLSFGPTGSWNQWEVSTLHLTLSAGINVVRLVTIGFSGPNIDSLIIG